MSATDTPLLELEHFSGPLDVLLERVRAQQIDLTRFSMREILDQFGTALEAAIGSRTLAELGDWVVMAAWLVLLRTRLMLPANEPGRVEAEQVAAALRSKVLRREQIARATDWLEERQRLGRDVFGRGGGRERRRSARRGSNAADLLGACLAVLRQRARREEQHGGVSRPAFWTVHDALQRINALLPALPPGSPLDRYYPGGHEATVSQALPPAAQAAIAATLIAGLEMAKRGTIEMHQERPLSTISVLASKPIRRSDELRGFTAPPGG